VRGRGEKDTIEAEYVARGHRHLRVAGVGRVEGTAEYADTVSVPVFGVYIGTQWRTSRIRRSASFFCGRSPG